MAGDKVSKAAKPQMRGLLNSTIKFNLITAITLAGVTALAFRKLYGDARKKRYADFYKTYDPEAHYERMRKAGLMQSASH